MAESDYLFWSLVVAVLAAVISIIAIIVSISARVDSKRSADAAEDSAAEARRANDRYEARDLTELNRQIRADLAIGDEISNGERRFYFANAGQETVRDLQVIDPPPTLTELPQRFSLGTGRRSEPFRLVAGDPGWPKELWVTWDGQPEPVPVEFPYDPMKNIY